MKIETVRMVMMYVFIKCPLCQEEFRNRYNLTHHIMENHNEIEADNFISIKVNKII